MSRRKRRSSPKPLKAPNANSPVLLTIAAVLAIGAIVMLVLALTRI